MATVFEFTISSEGLFPNKSVDIPSFTEEIQASSITATLVSVTIVGGNCVVTFATDLTDAEVTTLSLLVQAHTGLAVSPPDSLAYIWQVKNPLNSVAETALTVIGLASSIDDYKMMRPASLVGVNIRLKNQLTAGTLTITVGKNGVATNKSFTFDSTKPKFKLMIIAPGKITFAKGDSLSIRYSTDVLFLPLTNEIDVNCEVAWHLT